MNYSKVDQAAKIVWDYCHMGHKLEKADLVMALGTHDLRLAGYAAQLFLDDWAPLLVYSGGIGRLTPKEWGCSEAEKFAEIARGMDVPDDKMILEKRSTNTGENIRYTMKLLGMKGIYPQKIIVVQKPYMERRVYAVAKNWCPEKEFICTSPPISFEDYPNEDIPKDEFINIMVGDLRRIMVYPSKGYQIPQDVPDDVKEAFEKLVNAGYDKYLVE